MGTRTVLVAVSVLAVFVGGCAEAGSAPAAPAAEEGGAGGAAAAAGAADTSATGATATATRRLDPAALVYVGAFRLPGESGGTSWLWSGEALAYHAGGDPDGPDDGFPGSLFGVGHDHQAYVSEISIPKPVVSAGKRLDDLPTARTLQPFRDIREGRFEGYEMYRCGLAILPKQAGQDGPTLYWCWGQHMEEAFMGPTHGWSSLTLDRLASAGPWRIADVQAYCTNNYMGEIPEAWAAAHTGGRRLVTGRFRDGGQGGKGPCLYAIGPWLDGSPPKRGAGLSSVRLLQYTTAYQVDVSHAMTGYHESDEWTGVAWVGKGDRAAVVLVGTKGTGEKPAWYGFANGVVWPEEGPWPEVPPWPNDQRGWWSERFEAWMLFYDPSDLAKVAAGQMEPHAPQPYAHVRIDEPLFRDRPAQEVRHVGACAFDAARGVLYVLEFRGDEDKSLVHAWRVK